MSNKLEAYLEEISHYLSGRAERMEILSEIRSHILEKAAAEHGGTGDDAVDRAIAAYGPPRRVAERYTEDRPIIAPAFKRFLVRYTSLLFAVHAALTVFAVLAQKDFVIFPFLFMPRLGPIEAVMYLPTAFLADLGLVALVLYFVTQSGKDVKLPWPKIGVDLDEIKPPKKAFRGLIGTAVGAVLMLAVTDFALYLFARYHSIFIYLTHGADPKPLFTPEAGRYLSMIVIASLAVSTMALLIKLFTRSPWVNIVSNLVSLGLIGLILRQSFDDLFAIDIPEKLLPVTKANIKIFLLIIALIVTYELVRDIVRVSRRKLAKSGTQY
jgi:HAAS